MSYNKKYNRFFAFGCSYTNFFWPSWPEIIERDLGIPSENWGFCGAGNVAIMHRIVECDIKNNFTDDDLIVVTWSSWSREDRYLRSGWTQCGNIFNDTAIYTANKFRNMFWDPNNDIIKNLGSIYITNKSYNINYQAQINENIGEIYTGDILEFYKPHIPKETFPWSLGEQHPFNGMINDWHPDILAHLNYVENYIYPSIGCTMKNETISYYNTLQQKILDAGNAGIINKKVKKWRDLEQFFNEYCDTPNKPPFSFTNGSNRIGH